MYSFKYENIDLERTKLAYGSISSIIWLAFAGTQLLSTTLGVKEYVENEFKKLEEGVILPNKQLFPSPITIDDFFWAFGILRSRAFSRLRGQNLVLIPLVDFVSSFSHSDRYLFLVSQTSTLYTFIKKDSIVGISRLHTLPN